MTDQLPPADDCHPSPQQPDSAPLEAEQQLQRLRRQRLALTINVAIVGVFLAALLIAFCWFAYTRVSG